MSEDYLDPIRRQFETDGYRCFRAVVFADRTFDFIAVSEPGDGSHQEMFVFARFPALSAEELLHYAADCAAWARFQQRERPRWSAWLPGGGLTVYCIALLPHCDETLRFYQRTNAPLTVKHFGRLVPLLYDADANALHGPGKISWLGSGWRRAITERLQPSGSAREVPVVEEATADDCIPFAEEIPAPRRRRRQPRDERAAVAVVSPFATVPLPLDAERVQAFFKEAYRLESLLVGLLLGLFTAVLTGGAYGLVNALMDFPLEWLPVVGAGLLIGQAVRLAGRGVRPRFGIAAGALTLVACLLSRLIATLLLASYQMPWEESLATLFGPGDPGWRWLLDDTLRWQSLLSIALSVGQGYYFAFRHIRPRDIAVLAGRGGVR